MIGFKGDRRMIDTVVADTDFNRLYTIPAGKLRRYYGVPLWKQLLDIPTVLSNLRDVFRVLRGVLSAVRIMRRERPDVVFAKGGFVGIPVAIAAKITNTPLVTHDSDFVPGLANRISARWASVIATGAPTEFYHYPAEKMVEVGVPVDNDVLAVKKEKKDTLLQEAGLSAKKPVVTIVGGTNGGKEINEAVLTFLPELLEQTSVVQIAGTSNFQTVKAHFGDKALPKDYLLEEIVGHTQLMKYFALSDVVISRVGASVMAELALLGSVAILIPNPKLTGGHQIKNGQRYQETGAAIVLDQESVVSQPELLKKTVVDLLNDPKEQARLSKNMAGLAKPDATKALAEIIVSTGRRRRQGRH